MTTQENPQKDNHVLCGYPFYAIRNGPSINYAPCCWATTKSNPPFRKPLSFEVLSFMFIHWMSLVAFWAGCSDSSWFPESVPLTFQKILWGNF